MTETFAFEESIWYRRHVYACSLCICVHCVSSRKCDEVWTPVFMTTTPWRVCLPACRSLVVGLSCEHAFLARMGSSRLQSTDLGCRWHLIEQVNHAVAAPDPKVVPGEWHGSRQHLSCQLPCIKPSMTMLLITHRF